VPTRRSGLPLLWIAVIGAVVLVLAASIGSYLALHPSSGSTNSPGGGNGGTQTREYPTYFNQSGLPSTVEWSVTVDGEPHAAAGVSIVVNLSAGLYPYSFTEVPGYVTPAGGSVTVAAPRAEVGVTFLVFEFSLGFSESGLPNGTSWSVTVDGQTASSTTNLVAFAEPNGTYGYSIGVPADYVSAPASGTFTVHDAAVLLSVNFTWNSSIGPPSTITVGGSTSVYPFVVLAAQWFEQNNSNVVMSVNQGGTGAGMLAVCAGQINVGMASLPENLSSLESSDNCPSTTVITPIAYDATDIVIADSNPHGLLSLDYDTLNLIYEHASTTTPYAEITTLNGEPLPVGYPAPGTPLDWDQIPATAANATVGALAASPEAPESAGAGSGGAACATPYSDDICAATPGVSATPCGWSICAGGNSSYPAGDEIAPVERSDASGATQSFESRLLGYNSSTAWASGYANLGFTGCGSNNLLSDCGITVPDEANGNPGVLALVAGDPNAIGYASDGIARSWSGIGTGGLVPFLADGESLGHGLVSSNTSGLEYGGVAPTLGAGGSIAAGITDSSSVSQYAGWRPFELVTTSPPSGEVQRFFEFILDPANNVNLATSADEVSIYSV